MTRTELRRAWTTRPFVAFSLHLPDGRVLRVPHPEMMSIGPDGRTFIVWFREGGHNTIDIMLVSDLEFERKRGARRSA